MDIKKLELEFEGLCAKVKREGFADFLKWLYMTDYLRAPASTKYHGAYEGGLLEHSLNVYNQMIRLTAAYPEVDAPEESIIISALFHDLCKVNMYKPELKYKKDANGQWEQYVGYIRDEKFKFGGHGSKSVFILSRFIKLTTEEAVAINCHMSCWDGDTSVGAAFEQTPFAWLLHVADEGATYIDEGKR